jgi:hypothetical protein
MLMAELLAEGQAAGKSVSIHVEHDTRPSTCTTDSGSDTWTPAASVTSWSGGRNRLPVLRAWWWLSDGET